MSAILATDRPAAAPVVKWAGGKTHLLPELLARMPARFGTYFEPFAGGLALFFRVVPERAVLNDLNEDLIALYHVVAHRCDALVAAVDRHRRQHCDVHYYAMRTLWNRREVTGVERAALFLYLNKTCFNGLWRVNRAGDFNAPMGRYDDPAICDPDKLRAASAALGRASLRCGDYRAAIADAERGDFVYFDPPYDETFTGYTAGAFGRAAQRKLAALVRDLVACGVNVMLSNSDTPLVRELYEGLRIDRVQCPRAINSNAEERGAVDEVIVTSGYLDTEQRKAQGDIK